MFRCFLVKKCLKIEFFLCKTPLPDLVVTSGHHNLGRTSDASWASGLYTIFLFYLINFIGFSFNLTHYNWIFIDFSCLILFFNLIF